MPAVFKVDGKALDVNQNAHKDEDYSRGPKSVVIGYKTTTDRKEAITDIALMNMKGGYSTHDYDELMQISFKEQIILFVDKFLAAIKEYRTNYKSGNDANKKRAKFVHDLLNKLTDDDCGGAPLGDLLIS